MDACYRPVLPAAIAALHLAAAGSVSADPIALREICDESTALALVGVDTASRTVLISLPSRQEAVPGWLLELGEGRATLYPDRRPGGRFGGSTGPGPVLVLEPCGEACVQAAEWSAGEWKPIGPPLDTAGGATLHPARDGGGRPWIVQHFPGPTEHARRVVAALLTQGRWQPAGQLDVSGAGSPAALPDPDSAEALISGSGRFVPGEPAETWVRMPPLGPDARGSLVPLGAGRAACVTPDSRLLITRDGGGQWFEQRWTPWRDQDGVNRGESGEHYWLDLPTGTVSPPLALLWYDDRPGREAALWLTGGEAPADLVAAVVPRAARTGSEPIAEAIHWGGGDWLLVSGCRRDQRTAYVLVRTPRDASPGSWTRLALEPGW